MEVLLTEEVTCRCSPGVLWPILADTQRMNQALGLASLQVSKLEAPGASRFAVRTWLGGFPVAWEEQPVEFEVQRFFRHRRVMRSGALRLLEYRQDWQALPDGGTRISLTLQLVPTLRVLVPIAWLNGRRSLARMVRYIAGLDAALAAGRPTDVLHAHRAGKVSPQLGGIQARLEEAAGPSRRAIVERLVDHVRTASDDDLLGMRPFALADTWGTARRDTLTVFLRAVDAGLLSLTWELICPSCRTASDRLISLDELGEEGHCHLCDLDYALDLDQAVEATFQPAPAVRKVQERLYCISGPSHHPHVHSQAVLEPGASKPVQAPVDSGRYRLFARGGAKAAVEVRPEGPTSANVRVGESIEPASIVLAPGGRIELELAETTALHVKLEEVMWARQAATAATLSTFPEFRRRFSGDTLRPGLALKIARTSLLFSDLVGSTNLYTRQGDGPAFSLIQDHFAILEREIERAGGAIVKTIGDAVMAAFEREQDAFAAALAIQTEFQAFRRDHPEGRAIDLRLGLHEGPCYMVTANDRLDYFGQTVNIAARLEGQAGPGEIVMSRESVARARELGWLPRGSGWQVEDFDAVLKGIDGVFACCRLRPPGATELRAAEPPG